MIIPQIIKDEIKSKITIDYNGRDLLTRRKDSIFFTPPELIIQMLEYLPIDIETFSHSTIYDPTCGNGNLLIACLITGQYYNPEYYKLIYGNELHKDLADIAVNKLKDINPNFDPSHITNGDILNITIPKVDINFMNPPYGLGSCLAKRILKRVIPNSNLTLSLNPSNVIKDKQVKNYFQTGTLVDNLFSDATVPNLSIMLFEDKEGPYKDEEFLDIALKVLKKAETETESKQLTIWERTKEYNKSHTDNHIFGVMGGNYSVTLNKKLKEFKDVPSYFNDSLDKSIQELIDNNQVFFQAKIAFTDGVHRDGLDVRYNQNIEEFDFRGDPKLGEVKWMCFGGFIIFPTIEERNNFTKWWYSCNDTYTEKFKGLTNAYLKLFKTQAQSGCNALYFDLPLVDWSKSWSDEAILKEIELVE